MSIKSIIWSVSAVVTCLGYIATVPAQAATISANPRTLTFCLATVNDPAPAPQIFSVASSDGSVLAYSATSNQSWLLLKSTASGGSGYQRELDILNTGTDGSISVEIDKSAYASGSTSGNIAINASGGSFTDVVVNVKVDATCAPGKGLFSLSPASITFNNTQANPTLTVTGKASQVVFSATDDSGIGQWLTVSPGAADGAQPVPVTATVSANSALAAGTYHGHITIAQYPDTSNSISVPVTYTAGGTSGTFTAIPASLDFGTIQAGTSVRQDKTLTISSTRSVQVTTSVTMDQNANAGWLSVDQPAGSAQSFPIMVHVSPGSLTSGTYTGKVTVQETGNSSNLINVLVSVTINGGITITPSSLNFVYQVGGSVPAQNISVSSPSGTIVNFSATAMQGSGCGGNWLSAAPTQASTGLASPTQISVQINTSSLPANASCTGNIQITASGVNPPTTNIPVNLTVSTTPLIQGSVSSLTFNSQNGTQPSSQTFTVSTTSTALNYSIAVTPASSGGPTFVTVNPTSGSASAASASLVTVGIDPTVLAQLTPGSYTDTLTITSTSGSSFAVAVTLNIGSGASLSSNPTSLTTNYQIGQTQQPPDQILTVFSTGAPLQFSTSYATTNCGNFISSMQGSGNTLNTSGQNGSQIKISITIGSDVTQPTTCSGSVTLTPIGTSSLPLVIPVTVNVVNAPAINVGPPSAAVQSITSNAAPVTVSVPITSTDGTSHIGFTATPTTTTAGLVWLTASPQFGGTTPATLQIQFNPVNLSPGTYTGMVTISSPTSAVSTQVIPVTMIVSAQASVSPSSLAFTMPQGGTNPAAKTLMVTNVAPGTIIAASATTSSGGSWLAVGTNGNAVTVSANGSGLAAGQYNGTITIAVPGAPNSPLTVGVALTVTQPITLSVDNANLSFSATAGATTSPASKTVQLTASTSTAIPFTATPTSQNGFLTVTPSSGSTPGTLTVGVNPTVLPTLPVGNYTGTVTITSTATNSTATINVTLAVAAAIPTPSLTTLLSAATLTSGPVSPGELVALKGVNLGPTSAVNFSLTPSGTVPTTLGGTQVFFDTVAAPLLYVSATQINAIVPYEVAGRAQTSVTIVSNGITSTAAVYRVADVAPGIFTSNASGAGLAAVVNQNNTVNGPATPAPKGSVISIFGTGEGLLNAAGGGITASVTGANPPFPQPRQPVTVTFLIPQTNGTTTSETATVQYYGEAPTLVSGVLQVNVVVPKDAPSGSVTFFITVGSTSSPQVSVYVQ